MKKATYSLLFALILPTCIFGQGQVTQKLEETWNPDAGKWDFQQVDNWQYDEQGREILHTHEDVFVNDFVLEDKSSVETAYDANGNLILEIQRSFTDSTWREFRSEHQYDNKNRLIETNHKQTHSYDLDYLVCQRFTFEYNDLENIVVEREFSLYDGRTEWVFNEINISLFDDNDCLIKNERTRYKSTGEIYSKRKETWTRDADCQPLTRIFWSQNQNDTDLELKYKYIYEYSTDGKKITYTNQDFNTTTNEWNTNSTTVSEFDDDGQIIREYREYFSSDITEKNLQLYKYNEKGEQTVYRSYRTYNSTLGISELKLVTLDSAVFTYNELDQISSEERFSENYNYFSEPTFIFQSKIYTKYAYYCDGQLKSKTYENLPNINRTIYEYNKGGDCNLENEDLQMIVFPNPSDGNIEIRSSLLAASSPQICISSVLGQTIFKQKINHISERFSLNLTDLPNGNYLISIIDGKTIISKKIYILK